jgi:hypothetical protein
MNQENLNDSKLQEEFILIEKEFKRTSKCLAGKFILTIKMKNFIKCLLSSEH